MTLMRRTTTTPLGQPAAGQLTHNDMGQPVVPLTLGPDLVVDVDDPGWARDLMAAASVAASVLESALGIPAPAAPRCSCDEDPLQCAHQAARGQAEDDRDAFRALLARICGATSPAVFTQAITDARLALERYDLRDTAPLEQAAEVTEP